MKFDTKFAKSELESQVRETFAGVESFRIISPDSDIISPDSDSKIITLGTFTLNVTGGKVKEV